MDIKEKEIMENNVLIAEFLGYKKELFYQCSPEEDKSKWQDKDFGFYDLPFFGGYEMAGKQGVWFNQTELNFHNKYEWINHAIDKISLMPEFKNVVFEINRKGGKTFVKVYSNDFSFDTEMLDSQIKAMYISVITLIKLTKAKEDYCNKVSSLENDSNSNISGLKNYINNILYNAYLIGQENKTTTPERNFKDWDERNKITDNVMRVIFESFKPIIIGAFNKGWIGKK